MVEPASNFVVGGAGFHGPGSKGWGKARLWGVLFGQGQTPPFFKCLGGLSPGLSKKKNYPLLLLLLLLPTRVNGGLWSCAIPPLLRSLPSCSPLSLVCRRLIHLSSFCFYFRASSGFLRAFRFPICALSVVVWLPVCCLSVLSLMLALIVDIAFLCAQQSPATHIRTHGPHTQNGGSLF